MIITQSTLCAFWSALLWLFLSSLGNARFSDHVSRVGGGADSPKTLFTRQWDTKFVFRGDNRDPTTLKSAGGFFPHVPAYAARSSSFSMYRHMEKSPFGTAFVSISHSPDISIDYTEYFGNKGFIYVIKPTANIIDAEKSRIRDNSLQQECLALGGVSWSQVHGWIPQERYEAWMRSRSPALNGLDLSVSHQNRETNGSWTSSCLKSNEPRIFKRTDSERAVFQP
ncbi:hypothetical protein RJ55_06256 [Drechmeria coniospora]|nr:hypothetical protein RJ55_06256 [Drechmeria coniospora]